MLITFIYSIFRSKHVTLRVTSRSTIGLIVTSVFLLLIFAVSLRIKGMCLPQTIRRWTFHGAEVMQIHTIPTG